MGEISRRTIEELTVRYELEPNLNDIIVEGGFDSDLIASAASAFSEAISVYTIDTIEVPSSALEKHALTSGNKQRVIAVARELSLLLSGRFRYVCLVDRDLDHWLGRIEETRNLCWTNFSSLEMHFYDREYLESLICLVLKAKVSSFERLFSSMKNVLAELYALRLAASDLALSISWIPLSKCATLTSERIIFDRNEFCRRSANSCGYFSRTEDLIEGANRWGQLISESDIRLSARGHDLFSLLAIVAMKSGGIRTLSTEEAIARFLVAEAKNNVGLVDEVRSLATCEQDE